MKVKDLFENWGLTNIKLNVGFMEAEFEAKPDDQEAIFRCLFAARYTEKIATRKIHCIPMYFQ